MNNYTFNFYCNYASVHISTCQEVIISKGSDGIVFSGTETFSNTVAVFGKSLAWVESDHSLNKDSNWELRKLTHYTDKDS